MRWEEWKKNLQQLAESLHQYSKYLEAQNEKVLTLQHDTVPARSISDSLSLFTLPVQDLQSSAVIGTLLPIYNALKDKEYFEPLLINDLMPSSPRDRYRFIQMLKENGCQLNSVLFTFSTGNNNGNYHFLWLTDLNADGDNIQSRNASVVQRLTDDMPKFHSRAMRQKFVNLFGRMANIQPAYLREMYHELSGDCSAASSEIESRVNERVKHALELEDVDAVVDLRHHNKGQPCRYDKFWEACECYIHSNVDTAVDDRRHDRIDHLAVALSVPDLLCEVSKRVEPGTPIPSVQWLRLQFWPKTPSAKVALQYTGRLKLKYMVQKRQMRKYHEDAHYASALFRYQKEMAIKYRSHSTFVSLDDKHKVPLGEPGYPVASVERGKKVLVSVEKSFMVGDHDFTRSSLTPSVALFIEVPKSIDGSFYHGKVCVGIKDSVFEASSPHRHGTELSALLHSQGNKNPMMFIYTDGGPDHRVNYLSVQLTFICLFLIHDLDYLVAVQTPPYNSWKNPAERVMSELNLALQAVGMMREKLATAGLEKVLEGCNSMKDIRAAAKSHPGFQDEFTDSVQPPILLLSSLFQRLKLKDEPFYLFPSSSSSEVELFLNTLKNIAPDIQPAKCTKAANLVTFPKLKDFFEHCCHKRHYMFSIKKCGAADCSICKMPRLPKEVFDTICHLPDPVKDGDVYKPFSDVYGTITTEEDRPSLQSCAEKGNSGIIHLASLLGMWGNLWNAQSVVNPEYCIQLASCNPEISRGWILF